MPYQQTKDAAAIKPSAAALALEGEPGGHSGWDHTGRPDSCILPYKEKRYIHYLEMPDFFN